MQKKLLIAAVGAALVTGPMLTAQADVTVYGRAHVSLDSLDRDVSSDDGERFVSSNSSHIGFKASEDLGGGLKAIFGAEWQYTMDTSGQSAACTSGACTGTNTSNFSTIANRNTTVGLQGGFGTVELGHSDDIVKVIGRKVDLFYNEQLGESRAITRTGTGNTTEERLQNGIFYTSPKFGGATLHFEHGVEDSFTSDLTTTLLGVQFSAGPLYVGLAHKKVENTTEDAKVIRLVGQYKIGALTLSALFQSVDDFSNTKTNDRDAAGIGAAFKMGNNTFKAQFYQADDLGSSSSTGADQLSLGVDHHLSKNTIVYGTYAKTSNDNGTAAFGVGGNGHGASATPTANGDDASGVSVGIRMNF